MFDALRRAESERRRKQQDSFVPEPAREAHATRARESSVPAAAPAPAVARAVREPLPMTTPAAPGAPVEFPAGMLRELGILRNSIEAKIEKKSGRVLMFASAMHDEGATTLAIAYARLLALHRDQRILLVELNARTPAVAHRLGLSGADGVTHYFGQDRALSALVQRPAGENFDVVHVGIPDATQIQINLERAFPHLVEEAMKSYDTVIVDAPPIVVCPETPPLAPFVDGVVLVVHCGRTKRETVDRSIKQIQQFQGRVLGVVLNRKRYYIPRFIYRRL
jgi:Mrp family chromosome partitioning ATPase